MAMAEGQGKCGENRKKVRSKQWRKEGNGSAVTSFHLKVTRIHFNIKNSNRRTFFHKTQITLEKPQFFSFEVTFGIQRDFSKMS